MWMDINGGFRALDSAWIEPDTGVRGQNPRTLNMTALGPLVGVGFGF